MQYLAHKYKLLPNQKQSEMLAQWEGSARWLWNQFLAKTSAQYELDKKFIFGYELKKLIPVLKQNNTWLKDVPAHALQNVAFDIDKALKAVWQSNFGFPKFKSKNKNHGSLKIDQVISNGKDEHIKINPTHITMPKIGQVKWVMHRPLPLDSKIKSITITKEIDDWFVSVLLGIPGVTQIKIKTDNAIGLDLGVASFATLSDGTKIESQNFLKKSLKKLKYEQRKLRKKVKGSANTKKQYKKIAKIHRNIRNARNNWLHHQSKALVNKYDLICIENLKIKDLLEKKVMSRSIADQGWGIFVNQLQYKAVHKGKHVTKIGTYQPSTKTCSCCGAIKKITLADRVYICENVKCNDYLKAKDRDVNAAQNILFWGIAATEYELFDYSSNTDGISEINACGDTPAQYSQAYDWHIEVSTKQEATCPLGS